MNTVLITGGTGGIGRELVRAFSREGWRAAFTYRRSGELAETLARECGALPIRADLSGEEGCLSAFEQALSALGHLDCLLHCAGVDWQGLLSDMPTEAWDHLMQVNLRSAFLLSREALKTMRGQGRGSLLFITSVQARGGGSCESAYAASKAALEGLCRSLAAEWGPAGIRVNCLSPGVIDAGMMSAFSADEKEALRRDTPLQRLGTPGDVAKAALFLCGDGASFITGQVLGVDGGLML